MKNSNPQSVEARLEKLAYRKTKPFCYSCYRVAPNGRCELCGSDDLMREAAGEGVDWGVSWYLPTLLRDNLTPVNAEEAFEEMVRECYPETVNVAWLELDAVTVLKDSDPLSWRMAMDEYADNQLSDEQWITVDNGATYYSTCEVEHFLDEAESEAVA